MIKDKFFNKIKNGDKNFEFREAHITFINEKTKEELRKDVIRSSLISIDDPFVKEKTGLNEKELNELFKENVLIMFKLE